MRASERAPSHEYHHRHAREEEIYGGKVERRRHIGIEREREDEAAAAAAYVNIVLLSVVRSLEKVSTLRYHRAR